LTSRDAKGCGVAVGCGGCLKVGLEEVGGVGSFECGWTILELLRCHGEFSIDPHLLLLLELGSFSGV
jgi:hypothetical protein